MSPQALVVRSRIAATGQIDPCGRLMEASARRKWAHCFAIVLVSSLLHMSTGAAADPTLDIEIGGDTRHIARDALLVEPDATTVEVADDVSYGKPMSYRAIQLA